MLKVNIENLGNISNGEIDINNFTIFTGENNTGKTYATYAIYSLLDKDFQYNLNEIRPIIDNLYKDGIFELDLKSFFYNFFDKNYKKNERRSRKFIFKKPILCV